MTSTATHTRRTSTYVLAFHPGGGWTPAERLDDLLIGAKVLGYLVQGSHTDAGTACLVLRFPDDEAAIDAAHALSAESLAPLAGVVTGLGVHRREVQA